MSKKLYRYRLTNVITMLTKTLIKTIIVYHDTKITLVSIIMTPITYYFLSYQQVLCGAVKCSSGQWSWLDPVYTGQVVRQYTLSDNCLLNYGTTVKPVHDSTLHCIC